jgi:hypothetical protein
VSLRAEPGGEPEVDQLHVTATREDHVRRLDVPVNDRGLLVVQKRQRLGGLGEIFEHARQRQARGPVVAEELREVRAVDPIHHDHVLVALEEVLAHERERRMRRQPE